MPLIYALILGLIRGAAGVLPISSAGLSALAGRLMDVDLSSEVMFNSAAGAGVLAAVAIVWHREIIKTVTAFGGIICDISANLLILITGKNNKYRRIVTTAYRKMTVMLLISFIPSVIISCLFGSYAVTLYGNLLVSSIGMLLTAMILMVASFAKKQSRGPKESGVFAAAITGLFYGFSVFPGISRIGTASAGCFISEFTARFTAAYVFLMYFFTGIFSTVTGLIRGSGIGAQAGAAEILIGILAAAASGYFVLKLIRKRIYSSDSIGFAVCSACVGIILLVLYFV